MLRFGDPETHAFEEWNIRKVLPAIYERSRQYV
jgi:hypothetical protein